MNTNGGGPAFVFAFEGAYTRPRGKEGGKSMGDDVLVLVAVLMAVLGEKQLLLLRQGLVTVLVAVLMDFFTIFKEKRRPILKITSTIKTESRLVPLKCL